MANLITGRLTTIIDADNSGLLAKIKQSTAQLKKLANFKTPTIGLDNKVFLNKVSSSSKALNKLIGKKVSIDANNQSLINKVKESSKAITRLGGKKVSITTTLPTNKPLSNKSLSNNLRSKKITIGLNNKVFLKKVRASITSFNKLKSKTISINAKAGSSSAKISKIKKLLTSLKGKTIPINVTTGSSAAKIKKATKDVQNLGKSSKKTTKDIAALGKQGDKTGSFLSGMTKGVIFTSIIAGVTLLTKKILALTIAAERTEIAFQSLLDSNAGGSQLFDDIINLAKVTPFTSTKLNKAAKIMLSYGIAGNKIIPTLRMVGDVSAATGAQIDNLALAFGQIASTGRLQGQDLRQLVNAGFNPLQVIAEKTGRSMSDLKDDMVKGLIPFSQVNQAFKDVTSNGGRFFGMMERQSRTVGGRLSTLKDTLEQIGRNLGEMAQGGLKLVVEQLIKAAEAFETVTSGKGEATTGQKAAVGAAAGAGAAVIGVTGIGTIAVAGTIFADVIKSIGTAIWAATDEIMDVDKLSKFGKIKLALQHLVDFGEEKAAPFLRRMVGILSKGILLLTGTLGKFLAVLSLGAASIASIAAIALAIEKFNKTVDESSTLMNSLTGSIKHLFGLIESVFKTIIEKVKPFGEILINFVTAPFKFLVMVVKDTMQAFSDGMVSSLVEAFKPVLDELTGILDALTFGLFSKFTQAFSKIKEFIVSNSKPVIDSIIGILDALTFGLFSNALEIGKSISSVGDFFKSLSSYIADFLTFGAFSEIVGDTGVTHGKDGGIDFGGGQNMEERQKKILKDKKTSASSDLAKTAASAADKFRKSFEEVFGNVNLELDFSKAKESILKNKEEFMSILPHLGDGVGQALNELGSKLDLTSIEDILSKAPKDLVPTLAELVQKLIDIERQKISDAFNNVSSKVDITGAKESILKSKEEFNKLLDKFADEEIFKGIKNIDELLKKVPKELLPDLEGVLNKLLDAEHQKILNLFSEVSDEKDIETTKSDILKNKVFYEPLLAEFGFDNFQDAFLKIPGKLLPAFKNVLEKLAPNFSARLGQVRKNLNVFNAKRKIAERLKEGKFNDNLDIPNQEIAKVLKAFVKSTPEENLPDVLSLINEFFPKAPKEDDNKNKNRLAGAVMKGSVAAHGVLLARQEAGTEKKIENNTALAVEVLRQIKEGGISLKNVAVAN